MEKRRHRFRESVLLKFIAVIIAAVAVFVGFFSAIFTIVCIQNDVYYDGGVSLLNNAVREKSRSVASIFASKLYNNGPYRCDSNGHPIISETVSSYSTYSNDLKNYRFEILDIDSGEVFYSSIGEEDGDCTLIGETNNYIGSVEVLTDGRIGYEYENYGIYSLLNTVSMEYSMYGFRGNVGINVTFHDRVGPEAFIVDSAGGYNSDEKEPDVTFDKHYSGDPASTMPPENDTDVTTSVSEWSSVGLTMFTISDDGIHFSPSMKDFELVHRLLDDPPQSIVDTDIARVAELIDAGDGEYHGNVTEDLRAIRDVFGYFENELLGSVLLSSDISVRDNGVFYFADGTVLLSETRSYPINTYITGNVDTVDEIVSVRMTCDAISEHADTFPKLFIVSAVALLLSVVWLCATSGWRETSGGKPEPIWFDKIPLEFFAVAVFTAVVFTIQAYLELRYDYLFYMDNLYVQNYRLLDVGLWIMVPLVSGLIFVLTLMTLSTRLKCGVFIKYTATGFCLRIAIRLCKAFFGALRRFWERVRLCWKIVILWMLFSLYCLFWYIIDVNGDAEVALLFILVGLVALLVTLLVWAGGFSRICRYVKKLANGELDAYIVRDSMPGDLGKCVVDLENISEGVKKAVDEQMRSERLKTELITNVSHDLKTPLTSIVNYIDILSKDEIENETAREHVEVIKRQADRMKKLIEDLVEVSKASSGNVSVNLARTDVNLLLTQCSAEYAERFRACGLEAVINVPDKKLIANLDGRLMWRVFDNLCNNICKYALPHTRVYITAESSGVWIKIAFKNISRTPLEMTGKDLIERFVRGDASRNTEGSGLGLSIAKSLCDLQNVGFGITVDGDLFKAELNFAPAGDEEFFRDEPVSFESGIAEEYDEEPEDSVMTEKMAEAEENVEEPQNFEDGSEPECQDEKEQL